MRNSYHGSGHFTVSAPEHRRLLCEAVSDLAGHTNAALTLAMYAHPVRRRGDDHMRTTVDAMLSAAAVTAEASLPEPTAGPAPGP